MTGVKGLSSQVWRNRTGDINTGSHTLLILGCGYVGERLATACRREGMRVIGGTRSRERARALERLGIEPAMIASPSDLPDALLARVDKIVDSVPLSRGEQGMRASQPAWLPTIAPKLVRLKWAAYLSATSVYGDAHGAWVDETDACKPTSGRGKQRLLAEKTWLQSGLPVEIFRLAGIYGPGRNIISRLRAGGYEAVRWQPSHWSSRIHVDDIIAAILASMRRPRPGRIVNLADDAPSPHADYVQAVARMVDAPAPLILTPEEGRLRLSPAQMSFFADNKRVSNRLLHRELLPELKYPDFRRGMASL